jgi:hypothetical protein
MDVPASGTSYPKVRSYMRSDTRSPQPRSKAAPQCWKCHSYSDTSHSIRRVFTSRQRPTSYATPYVHIRHK